MSKTEIFGILNLTPDSFSDGGTNINPEIAIENAETMLELGASYIDVGAESTKPGATPISEDEEWRRLENVLPILIEKYPGKISLDSYKPRTIQRAFEIGSIIINDVTSFSNVEMIEVALENDAICIISHLPDYFKSNIQKAHKSKEKNFITASQVREELLIRQNELVYAGIDKNKIILDPGIGFGKTFNVNRQLLTIAKMLPERDVMIGYSKKKFIGETRFEPESNLALGRIAIEPGTKYLRLHQDLIQSHKELIDSYGQL